MGTPRITTQGSAPTSLRKFLKPLSTLILSLSAVAATSSASAMTRVVEKYGSDANPCTVAAPCETIGAAMAAAGDNGRVIVGPGDYSESLVITNERMQITSRLGAEQTVISAPYFGYASAITIESDRVVFGQRNKGFTIKFQYGLNGVFGATTGTRVEGNIIRGYLSYGRSGISLSGNRNTVRYNQILSNGYSSESVGIKIDAPVLSGNSDSGFLQLVQGNEVHGAAQCYRLASYARNDRNRVLDNVGRDCAGGIRVNYWAPGQQGYALSSTGRITNNSIHMSNDYYNSLPYGLLTVGGTPVISKTRIDMTEGGLIGISVVRSTGANVNNSSVIGGDNSRNDGSGMMFNGRGRTAIANNSIVGVDNGLRFSGFRTSRPIRNNNIWGADTCALALDELVTDTQRFAGNFWGSAGSPPDTSCDPETAGSVANGALKFAPASIRN